MQDVSVVRMRSGLFVRNEAEDERRERSGRTTEAVEAAGENEKHKKKSPDGWCARLAPAHPNQGRRLGTVRFHSPSQIRTPARLIAAGVDQGQAGYRGMRCPKSARAGHLQVWPKMTKIPNCAHSWTRSGVRPIAPAVVDEAMRAAAERMLDHLLATSRNLRGSARSIRAGRTGPADRRPAPR